MESYLSIYDYEIFGLENTLVFLKRFPAHVSHLFHTCPRRNRPRMRNCSRSQDPNMCLRSGRDSWSTPECLQKAEEGYLDQKAQWVCYPGGHFWGHCPGTLLCSQGSPNSLKPSARGWNLRSWNELQRPDLNVSYQDISLFNARLGDMWYYSVKHRYKKVVILNTLYDLRARTCILAKTYLPKPIKIYQSRLMAYC